MLELGQTRLQDRKRSRRPAKNCTSVQSAGFICRRNGRFPVNRELETDPRQQVPVRSVHFRPRSLPPKLFLPPTWRYTRATQTGRLSTFCVYALRYTYTRHTWRTKHGGNATQETKRHRRAFEKRRVVSMPPYQEFLFPATTKFPWRPADVFSPSPFPSAS